jgi:hypothetical protein
MATTSTRILRYCHLPVMSAPTTLRAVIATIKPPTTTYASGPIVNNAQPRFEIWQTVYFNQQACTIVEWNYDETGFIYLVETTDVGLRLWLPEEQILLEPSVDPIFLRRSPHLVVVDQFLANPDAVRWTALRQTYQTDERFYKGQRTREHYLWPGLKEEFERLLHCRITDWLSQPMNGVFQITGYNDPLVWHHDTQDYAAALYLTPDAPISAGTSFWKLRTTGNRRPSEHPLEYNRFLSDEDRASANAQIYSMDNIMKPDNWELCDRVGSVYNRLVLWDAKLIHSASSYEGMVGERAHDSRLVQLFFFSVA